MRAHHLGFSFGVGMGLLSGCGDGTISELPRAGGQGAVLADGAAPGEGSSSTSSTTTTSSSTVSTTGSGGAGGGTNGQSGSSGSSGTGGTSGASTDSGSSGPSAWRPFNNASPWNTPIASNPSLAP